MNCTQTRRQLKFGYPAASEMRAQMAAHARQCLACRQALAVEQLTVLLVRSSRLPNEDASLAPYSEQRLVYRTMTRIRELKARGANSWTAAVIGLRGWLFAFGTAALLLLALSGWEVLNSASRSSAPEETAFDLTLAPSAPSALDEELDNVHR